MSDNMIPWNHFKNRRKVDLFSLVNESQELNTYKDIVEYFREMWVEPPSEAEFNSVTEQIRDQHKIAGIEKIKRTGMSPTGRKLKKGEDPEVVWSDSVAGSYSSAKEEKPKVARKTRTPRKTTTRKTSTRKKS